MKTIQAYLETKQQEFGEHPFFALLETLDSPTELCHFIPELTFWTMAFQDILRINETYVRDPELKKIARHHRLEDKNHDQWFLHDKLLLSHLSDNRTEDKEKINWLFSQDCEVVRDGAYAIMAEVFNANDEILNIILLLTLESSGHVFFTKMSERMKKIGLNEKLHYFSSQHLEVELAHSLYEAEMEHSLFSRRITIKTRRAALKMIDRCYVAFHKMFDGLCMLIIKRLTLSKSNIKQKGKLHHLRS